MTDILARAQACLAQMPYIAFAECSFAEEVEDVMRSLLDALTASRQQLDTLNESISEAEDALVAAGRPEGERFRKGVLAILDEAARLREQLDDYPRGRITKSVLLERAEKAEAERDAAREALRQAWDDLIEARVKNALGQPTEKED